MAGSSPGAGRPNPISALITPATRVVALVCGWITMAYACALTAEIVGRKLFNISFKGIDELGGFVLAITAAIGASYAMANRSHTRVDVFLVHFPKAVQRWLNTLAMLCFAFFAGFATWRGIAVLQETIELGSSAVSLEQPLWVAQLAWVIGLGLLTLIAVAYAVHAVWLLATGRPELNMWYGPFGAQEELDAELDEIHKRTDSSNAPADHPHDVQHTHG